MNVEIVWKGYGNVRHIYPRTHVIKRLLAQWGVPRKQYENLHIVIEFCRIMSNGAYELFGCYRGERDGKHYIQINSDLILYLNQMDEFGPTGTHELHHLAWRLLHAVRFRVDRNGFRVHCVISGEELACKNIEHDYRWIVGIDFKKLPFEKLKVRRRGYRFTQLELFS